MRFVFLKVIYLRIDRKLLFTVILTQAIKDLWYAGNNESEYLEPLPIKYQI